MKSSTYGLSTKVRTTWSSVICLIHLGSSTVGRALEHPLTMCQMGDITSNKYVFLTANKKERDVAPL